MEDPHPVDLVSKIGNSLITKEAKGSKSYPIIPKSLFHQDEPKNHFGYTVHQADETEYF